MSDLVNTLIKKTMFAKIENNTRKNILRLTKIKVIREIINATPSKNIVNLRSKLGLPKNIHFFATSAEFFSRKLFLINF